MYSNIAIVLSCKTFDQEWKHFSCVAHAAADHQGASLDVFLHFIQFL